MCRLLKWAITLSIRNVSDFEALTCQVALSQICVLTQIQNIKQTRQIADLAELIKCSKPSQTTEPLMFFIHCCAVVFYSIQVVLIIFSITALSFILIIIISPNECLGLLYFRPNPT